ncbi:hypothetical protein [Amycolatopsis sp. YIM 10]|uniref:hypothetical protein n=1 Tax=Amycolatopsis sp. YIM 10 TaxID=2653857 RepID=UPI0012901337|nr:hypothetical protein [Amycolatopsis sp. YIM 10]QFU87877.1 hypothetical protein YIM_13455 [Amycolatopsis sp. YIM 10]QFU94810.1 hypothetical protein YIM_48425 [Amycolatopsis sp. YIM 10]
MNPIQAAHEQLTAALSTVDGCRVYGLGDSIAPPGLVVGAPRLAWDAYNTGGMPTSATFPVFLVVGFAERTLPELYELVPVVAQAIETTDATIAGANPGTYVGANTELPAYTFDADFPLTQEMGA